MTTDATSPDLASRRLATVLEHVRLENSHDLEGLMSTFGSTGFYDDAPWDEHHEGLDAVRAYYAALLRAAPDFHIEVVSARAAQDAVVLEVRLTGTHRGTWRGLPATGRTIDIPICAIFTFDAQDRLAGERIYYDRATVLRQLGVFFEPDTMSGKLLTPLLHPLTMLRALREFAAPRPAAQPERAQSSSGVNR